MRLYKIGILLGLYVLPTTGQALSTEIFMRRGKKNVPLEWKYKEKNVWTVNDEGVPVYGSNLVIAFPRGVKGDRIKTRFESVVTYNKKKTAFRLNLFSLKEQVLPRGKGRKKYMLTFLQKFEEDQIISEECEGQNLFLLKSGEDKKTPFSVHMKCYKREDKDFVVIVVPKDVRWSSTTIPELRGKGEHWKEYKIEDLPAGEDSLRASFSFVFKGESFDFDLKSKTQSDAPEDKDSQTTLHLGLGMSSLSVKSDISDESASPFSILLNMQSPLQWWNLRVGLSLNVPQQFSEVAEGATKPPEFFEAKFLLAKDYKINHKLTLSPAVVGVFSETSDPNVFLKIKHQHLGFGGGLKYQMTDKIDAQFDIWMSGFLASNPTSQMGLMLRVIYAYSKKIGFGLELGNQTLSAESSEGKTNEMSEMHYNLMLRLRPF